MTRAEEAAGLYLDNHKPLTRYNWGDLQDAFIAGAEWQKGHLTVEDIKTILDISFWNNDPEKILEEYNRLCDTSKVTRR